MLYSLVETQEASSKHMLMSRSRKRVETDSFSLYIHIYAHVHVRVYLCKITKTILQLSLLCAHIGLKRIDLWN